MTVLKFKSFWPLPGGIENFVESLKKALTYIRNNKPTEEQLTKWFFDTFPDVTKERNVRSYINNTLKHSGLLIIDRTGITLSQDGNKYLEHPDNKFLFQTLDKNVLGFSEMLTLLGNKPCNLQELHKALIKELEPYHVQWTTAYGQPYWRVNWLRSMGFVTVRGHEFCLTDAGQNLLTELGVTVVKVRKEPKVKPCPEPTPESTAEKICTTLKSTEHASSEPEKYEEAIAEALSFLGFDVEHRGEAGETDVIAIANLGDEKYKIILDGKTTAGEKIIDRHISWPTMDEHREKHRAHYAVVVGPSFAGGDLLERAKMRYKVLCLETDTLIELLRIHSRTPLTLEDLKEVFSKVGLLRLEECTEFRDKKKKYEKQLELVPKLLNKLQELQNLGEPTTVGDLRWALEKKFSTDEIQQALSLLQLFGIVKKTEKEEYIAIMMPKVAAAKLEVLADTIRYLEKRMSILEGKPPFVVVSRPPTPQLPKREGAKRARIGEITPRNGYRLPILEALVEMGGRAKVSEVLNKVFDKMKDQLKPKDVEKLPSGISIRWENRAQWERLRLINEGSLKKDSPRGIWEITDAGRKFYENLKGWG
jgi:hypothetical protein